MYLTVTVVIGLLCSISFVVGFIFGWSFAVGDHQLGIPMRGVDVLTRALMSGLLLGPVWLLCVILESVCWLHQRVKLRPS